MVRKPAANPPLATVEKSNFRLTVVENKDHTSSAVQTAEDKKAMRVKWNGNWPVYTYYFRSAGYGILVSFLAFTIIEAFCSSFQSLSGLNHIG
jgi:ATP-binding cassette subfamily C (CFTR/MRP) protein 1